MNPRGPGDQPEYKVYRSRRSPLDRLRPDGDLPGLRDRPKRGREPSRPRAPRGPRELSFGRVLRWLVVALVFWLALSAVLFVVSAQLGEGVSGDTKAALDGDGNFFTGATILVLGSDERKGSSIDRTQSGPGRADSIMLVHASFGGLRKLSIPRDTQAAIPGHDTQKINAAYALGGPALTIRTVEGLLGNGLRIDHLIEVDFKRFPDFIDALGGVTVNNRTKICAPEFDNFYKGFNLPKGEQKLDGRRALGFARVRKNPCAPAEDDLDRAKRQQEVLSGVRGALFSPSAFVRLPLVSWRAPRTIRTDLHSPGLLGLATDVVTGGSGTTKVLRPSCLSCGAGGSLVVSEGERAQAVRELEGK